MLKRILSIVFSIVVLYLPCRAQDIIIKQSGDEIKAKVTKVGETEIEYHKFERLDGPVYTINKTEVFMIKYQDGSKDVFNGQPAANSPAPVQKNEGRPTTSGSAITATPTQPNPDDDKWLRYTYYGVSIGTEAGDIPFIYQQVGINWGGKSKWGFGLILGENFNSVLPGYIDMSSYASDAVNWTQTEDVKYTSLNSAIYATYNISNRFSIQAGPGLAFYDYYNTYYDPQTGNDLYIKSFSDVYFNFYGGCTLLFHKMTGKGNFVVAGHLGFNTAPGALLFGISFCNN